MDAAYQGLLARAPDEQALGHYSAQLAEHKDLAGLLANLSESQEHWAQLLALRSEDLVRCVYRALLNREPDEEALRSYAEHVRQDRSLTRLLSAVADSDEHWRILMAARAEELVRTAHQELSGTEPEENMVRSCAAQLRETRDLRPLLSSVARSPEHRDAILAMNAESSVVEHLARMGFEVASPNDPHWWLSREYWEETVRFGRALRELLSLKRIGLRYKRIIDEARGLSPLRQIDHLCGERCRLSQGR